MMIHVYPETPILAGPLYLGFIGYPACFKQPTLDPWSLRYGRLVPSEPAADSKVTTSWPGKWNRCSRVSKAFLVHMASSMNMGTLNE